MEARNIVTACALVAAMLVAGWIARRRRAGAVLLALLGVVWLAVDHSFEGGVLIKVFRNHGLVTADLVGLAAIIAAVWLWFRPRRP